jgi:hypothetical protein
MLEAGLALSEELFRATKVEDYADVHLQVFAKSPNTPGGKWRAVTVTGHAS